MLEDTGAVITHHLRAASFEDAMAKVASNDLWLENVASSSLFPVI